MKLSAGVLAKLCALGVAAGGCEAAYQTAPQSPTQPVEQYEEVEPAELVVPDPRFETIEPVEFAKPPPQVAPVAPRYVPAPPQKQVKRVQPTPYQDPCPACGMG